MSSLMRVHSTNPTQMVSLRCLTHQLKSIAKQNEMTSMVSTIWNNIKAPLFWTPTHHHHLFNIDIKKGGEPKLLHLFIPKLLGDQTKLKAYAIPMMRLYHKFICFSNGVSTKKGGEPKLLHLLTPQQFGDQAKPRVHNFSLMKSYHKIINFTKAEYSKLKQIEKYEKALLKFEQSHIDTINCKKLHVELVKK